MSAGVSAVIQTSGNTVGTSNGTSYACPKMAGLATCLWQAFPEVNNMKIVDVIKQSGSTANHPTDSVGYGIPNLKLAFTMLLQQFATSKIDMDNCTATIHWTSKDVGGMRYQVQRKAVSDADYITVGEVNADNGNGLTTHSYQFVNQVINANGATLSYRIVQIVDTSVEAFTAVYIDTSSISLTPGCAVVTADSTIKIRVAPNPVTNNITLIVQTPGAISSLLINIYDMEGRLMQQYKESKAAGEAVLTIPASNLVRGKYTITLYNGNKKMQAIKILKL
jgi:serine protease AprX